MDGHKIRENRSQSGSPLILPTSPLIFVPPLCRQVRPEEQDKNEQDGAVTGEAETSVARLNASQQLAVRWEGSQFVWHSLAHVNREFCLGLLESGQVELSLVPTEPNQFTLEEEPRFAPLAARCFSPLSRPAEVHVRHFFPPRFEMPDEGHFVLMQPWEYGYLPCRWIEPILQQVSEVWCYSRYVREVYRASGIPEERLQVVPLGVDTTVFNPAAPPYILTREPGTVALAATALSADVQRADGRRQAAARREVGSSHNRFVFLFAGGTLHRKGIDILLDAYLKAFTPLDDICLVIKDTGTQTVYRGQNERERILSLTDDRSRPPIVYVDEDLPAHQLAGLYTACDCLVQPYRGEGFCLPALEAMACGRPVIVPQGGPTDDFVDETVGWRVPAQRQLFSAYEGGGRIGEWDCVGPTWMLEVAIDDLAHLLRQVYSQREEVARRGAAAANRVQTGWTWQHACHVTLERLNALREKPLLRRVHAKQKAVHEAQRSETPTTGEMNGNESKSATPLTVRSQPTISLCMIVRNEERVLGDCLQSVQPWVDEIIIVDTGSEDRTVEIAHSFGARVFHFPWCDDFSAARNESLCHATGDWLFWMDADDTIPEACGQKLHELVFLSEDRVTGFLMQVHIPPAPGETGCTVVDHVKLFRNWPELRFEGRIHEQILEAIYRCDGRVERSDLYVVHSGYDYSPEGQQRKRERDLLLLEKDLQDRPDHPFVLFNIGMTAYHLKDYAKAVPALERCLA
ncbi:MAG: glycosyltransferase, partial [Armatimonadota bacterium]|nr:glycosyltransferase [Armatimonadota bacterium]